MPPDNAANNTTEQVTIEHSPLYLPIEDTSLLSTINDALNSAVQQRNSEKIDARTKTNNDFWAGQQVNDSAIDKRYQMAHVDNVIYPDLENRLMLAAGRTPDIIILPPDREQQNMESARSIQSVLREKIDSNTIKRLIKDGLRNLHTDFIGIIKPRWDVHNKDFTFELLLSENVFFAKGSKVPHDGYTIDGTDMLFQWVEEPVKVVMAKFPNKAQQLLQQLSLANSGKDRLPSHIRYMEVHFTWYDNAGVPMEGVCWKYQNLILDKMREPYFDYTPTKNNFFDRPHKPYILLSYQNRGRSVYDTTTTVEQAVPINRIVNKRLRQITEIADRAVPKLAFRGGSISVEMARNISTSPKEAIVLTSEVDDIRKEMQVVPSQPPNPILYQDLLSNRGRIDTLMATHGTTRGEVPPGGQTSGISKQISREGDMVTSDDMVDIVVERVVYEMVCWGLHFMRLYYSDDRDPVRLADKDETTDIIKIGRQQIDTDVDVVVKASTNDKQTMRANAIQMLEAKTIDPYTLFEDLDVPNPKERLKRLLAFQQGQGNEQQPADFTAYLKLIGVSIDETDEVSDQQRAQADIQALKAGQPVSLGERPPTQAYVAEFLKFVNGQEFDQLPPEVQQVFQQHVMQLRQQVQELEQQGGTQPTATPQPAPQPGMPSGAPPPGQPPVMPQQVPAPSPPAMAGAVQ